MNKQRMEMPYKHLIAKKNNTSKAYYMLAELIDNSIGSWKDNGGEENGEPLMIEVTIDQKEKEISVLDDAYGMNETELEDSIRLNKEKEGNSLNMFGVGLKNSAFWFGEDLLIETNNGKTSLETSIFTSLVEDKNSTIEWEVIKGKKKLRGTKVTISNIYKGRLINDTDFKQICNIFEIKYLNFISKGVNIEINLLKKNGGEINRSLDKVNILPQTIPDLKKDDFLESLKDRFEKEETRHIKDLYEKTIKLVKNNKPLVYKIDVPFKVEGKKEIIKFTFGIQDESNKQNNDGFKNYYGLTTLQDNRAINMPPDTALPLTNDYIRTNAKRLYGWAELGHIFRPDNNKQEFNFGEYKDSFHGLLIEIGKELELVADVVQNIVGTSSKSRRGNNKSSVSKIQNALSSKSDIAWNVDTEGSDLKLKIDDGKEISIEIIEVSIEDKESEDYFINASQVGKKSDNKFEIKFNINHPIWKPLADSSGNNIDTKIVTYPLVAIIGISTLGIREKIITDILGKEFNSKDMQTIINFISQVIIK